MVDKPSRMYKVLMGDRQDAGIIMEDTMDEYCVSARGYVVFGYQNWDCEGDRNTWAKVCGDIVTVKKSKNGTITHFYDNEMRSFCGQLGIDWDAMKSGDIVAEKISKDNALLRFTRINL